MLFKALMRVVKRLEPQERYLVDKAGFGLSRFFLVTFMCGLGCIAFAGLMRTSVFELTDAQVKLVADAVMTIAEHRHLFALWTNIPDEDGVRLVLEAVILVNTATRAWQKQMEQQQEDEGIDKAIRI